MVHSFGLPSPNTVKEELFDEIFVNLNKILGEYDIIFAGDLNIDELRPCLDSSKNHFSDMKDIFSLANLIQKPTCFKSRNSTLLHLILTNWPRGLKNEISKHWNRFKWLPRTRLNYFKSLLKKLSPKILKCRDMKHFDKKKFLHDLDSKLLQGDLYRNCDESYEELSEIFVDILNYRAPLKDKK